MSTTLRKKRSMNTEILRNLVSFIRSCASTVHKNRKHICVQKSDCASDAQGRAIVLYRNIVPEISHQFLKRSKIIEIVNIAVVPLRVGYPINTVFCRIIQIHNITFVSTRAARRLRVTHENISKVRAYVSRACPIAHL